MWHGTALANQISQPRVQGGGSCGAKPGPELSLTPHPRILHTRQNHACINVFSYLNSLQQCSNVASLGESPHTCDFIAKTMLIVDLKVTLLHCIVAKKTSRINKAAPVQRGCGDPAVSSRLCCPSGTVAAVSVFMAAVCHYRLHTTYKTHI